MPSHFILLSINLKHLLKNNRYRCYNFKADKPIPMVEPIIGASLVLSTYINIMAMRVATSAFNGLFVNPQLSIT